MPSESVPTPHQLFSPLEQGLRLSRGQGKGGGILEVRILGLLLFFGQAGRGQLEVASGSRIRPSLLAVMVPDSGM